jgi:hypothetical protein
MSKFSSMAAGLCLALAGGVVSADTVSLTFQGIAGGNSATTLRVGNQTIQAGHIIHQTSGGAEFRTFCIELAQNVGGGVTVYEVVDLEQAPVPGPVYDAADAAMMSAVIANAVTLGWIDSGLQADASQENYLGRMGAIQAALWAAVGAAVDVNSASTSASLRTAYLELTDPQGFDDSLRLNSLRALVNGTRQDMLYVVPLPTSALAGAGLLAVGFGVRASRRR